MTCWKADLRRDVLIHGMWGLGDNIYARPFVTAAARQYRVWLETPWPELYADLDIGFVQGPRRLRTQLKNMARQPEGRWSKAPRTAHEVRVQYWALEQQSIIAALELSWLIALQIRFDASLFDLPDMGPSPVGHASPELVAVIRPVTVRSEWKNEARNPKPEYIAAIATELMATHTVVVVADLEAGHEWLVGELPPAHQYFVRGELGVRELLALVRDADIVVGGVGWIVPAGLALHVNTFVVLGGHGGHNAPAKITDPRLDLSRIGFAVPERFCKCTNMLHDCDKTIEDPLDQFRNWCGSLPPAASPGGHSSGSAITRWKQALNPMTRTISTTSPAMPTASSDRP
jgi:hypothetical protein